MGATLGASVGVSSGSWATVALGMAVSWDSAGVTVSIGTVPSAIWTGVAMPLTNGVGVYVGRSVGVGVGVGSLVKQDVSKIDVAVATNTRRTRLGSGLRTAPGS